jgi:carbonic anhydrase/acetyltransferase-like protein (isoleucine patch superfamily)
MSISIAAIVHPTATVHCTAQLYAGVTVGAFAEIGKGCIIGHGAQIGEGAQVGAGVWVYNRASIGKGCVVGDRQRIREGWFLPDATEIPEIPRSLYMQLELPPLPELDMRPVVRAAENLQEAFAHHLMLGIDFGAIEMRAAVHAAHEARIRASWGGVAEPASNRFLNPDHKPRVKDIARPWDKAQR